MKQTDDTGLKKIEKILVRIFVGLGVLAVAGVLILIRLDRGTGSVVEEPEAEVSESVDTGDWEAGLSDSTLWLPDNCALYQPIPDFGFSDSQGNEFQISDFFGKPTVIVYWASWCEDCHEQMPKMKAYMDIAREYGDIQFLLIDRLDGERETKDAAQEYFAGLGVDVELYFDEGEEILTLFGIHNIPTTCFVDENGILIDWSPRQIETEGEFEACIQNLIYQKSGVLEQFVAEQLMDEEGGIHSSFGTSQETTWSSDVLSESQGLLLCYAAESGNRELFDRALGYIDTRMSGDGLTSWLVSGTEASNVNALLDDLRIYSGMALAQEQWGGYEEALTTYRQKLLNYGLEDGKYIDFYDRSSKQKAQRLTLCYIDLLTMEKLAEESEEFAGAYEAALTILENGQISESFPLYYGWYDYEQESYEAEELNAAEAMVTLLHLAQADRLPENTLTWMKKQMAQGGVKARFDTDGNVVAGYNYDSTAVYAMIAMIGVEVQDLDLTREAVNKMEKMRIRDAALTYNGAFGLEDGSGISSFDQLVPLRAYQLLENTAMAE